jgi:hypothetical protein
MARSRVWLLGLVVLLPGCVPSIEPLSDPAKAEPDKRLLGDWAKPGEKVRLRVDVPEVKGNPKGLMRGTDPSKANPGIGEVVWFFVTKLEQESYVNVICDTEAKGNPFPDFGTEGEFGKWQKAPGKVCLILHYSVADDELTVNTGDEKAIKALVKKEKFEVIKNDIPKFPEGWLAKHLAKNGPGELYPKEKGQKLVRQKK